MVQSNRPNNITCTGKMFSRFPVQVAGMGAGWGPGGPHTGQGSRTDVAADLRER